jgi:hypothetical protein
MISFLLLTFISFASSQINFIAVGDDSTGTQHSLAYSIDGIFWTSSVSTIFTIQGNDAAYSSTQNKWIAVGSGANTMAYSYDGKNWIGMGNSVFSTEGKGIYFSISQNLWIATGTTSNNMAKSTDGFTWTPISSPFNVVCNDVVYADGVGRWVAVGGNTNTIAHSTDATSWVGLGMTFFAFPGDQGLSVEFSMFFNQFIVTGTSAGNTQGHSLDGITWTGTAPLFSNTISGVAFGQNKWIITGPATPLPTPFANSTTGDNWIIGPQMTIVNGCRGITYNPSYDIWVATCYGTNKIIYSFDGNNWFPSGTFFSITGYRVATTGKRFDPFTIISDITGNILYNTSQILQNATINVAGNLTIEGDLFLYGILNVSSTSIVKITGNLNILGGFVANILSANQFLGISTNYLSLEQNSNMTLIFQSDPPVGTYSIMIANYAANDGQFRLLPILGVSSSKCIDSVQSYTSSALSVVITVGENCVNGTSSASTGLSREAMIGIIVGCIVVGIAVAVIIALITVKQRKFLTGKLKDEMKRSEMENMRHIAQASRGSLL